MPVKDINILAEVAQETASIPTISTTSPSAPPAAKGPHRDHPADRRHPPHQAGRGQLASSSRRSKRDPTSSSRPVRKGKARSRPRARFSNSPTASNRSESELTWQDKLFKDPACVLEPPAQQSALENWGCGIDNEPKAAKDKSSRRWSSSRGNIDAFAAFSVSSEDAGENAHRRHDQPKTIQNFLKKQAWIETS